MVLKYVNTINVKEKYRACIIKSKPSFCNVEGPGMLGASFLLFLAPPCYSSPMQKAPGGWVEGLDWPWLYFQS